MQKPKTRSFLETGRVVWLPIHAVRPNPAQPRKIFDPQGLQELARSIAQYGVLQPLSVRRQPDGYELVAGERRLRASKMAGLLEVPCIVLTVDEEQSGMLALVENLQRRDLDFIQEQAAARVGKSQSAVANKLRLLKHPQAVLDALRANHLSERHARALLRLEGEQARMDVLQEIIRRQMNVAATEQYIDRLLEQQKHPEPARRSLGRFLLRDVRLFLNTVEHNLDLIKNAGISAAKTQEETDQEIVLTIRIPKHAG